MDRDQVIRLAWKALAGGPEPMHLFECKTATFRIDQIERFAALVVAETKEDDAKISERLGWGNNKDVNPRAGTTIASAIRSSIKGVE